MKYLILFLALFKHSTKRHLENRKGTLGFMFFLLINFLLQIYIVQIMFMNTRTLAGWSKEEVFLVVGLSKLFGTIFSLFFQRSINHLVGEVKEGNLDLILTKPFSSQFYYSFFLLRSFEIINLAAPLILIGYSLSKIQNLYLFPQLIFMALLVICGVIIFYSIYISIASIIFWVDSFSSFPSVFNVFSIPLLMPTDIYGRGANFFLTFIFPLAFVITIPAKVMLNKADINFVLLGILMALVTFYISTRIWNSGLRHYSSASS